MIRFSSRAAPKGALVALVLSAPLVGCGGGEVDGFVTPGTGASGSGPVGTGGATTGKGGAAGAATGGGTAAGTGGTATGKGGAAGTGGAAGAAIGGTGGAPIGGTGGVAGANGGKGGASGVGGTGGAAGASGAGAGGKGGAAGASGKGGSGGATCGDGVKNGAEACDKTDLGGATCAKAIGKPATGALTCTNACALDTSACIFCGDGKKNGTELCDGTQLGGATCASIVGTGSVGTPGCKSDCTFDTNGCSQLPTCGDGVKDANDLCDGSDFGGATCSSVTGVAATGALSCTAQCTIDTSTCNFCGDKKKNGAEACDAGDFGGATCSSVAGVPATGALSCTASCTIDKSACVFCGDGKRDGAEACEGADLGGADCASVVGAGSTGTLSCKADCTLSTAACSAPPACGDGILNGTDQCDNTDFGSATCASALGMPATGMLACKSNCTLDTSACQFCGDGVKSAGEQCDALDLGGATCATALGSPAVGTLSCAPSCQLDTTACTPVAARESRGSAIAITDDDAVALVVNRDAGSVSVLALDHTVTPTAASLVAELPTGAGSEPWQVVIAPSGAVGYVILRRDQRVVRIDNLKTAAPSLGASIAVGSEPTGLALSPSGATLYVANWGDGTVTALDTASLSTKSTIDLNAAIVATGLLGVVTPRPALAHPRSIAISNNGNTNDDDETIVVTEFFAQRIAPEDAATKGKKSDTSFEGIVYAIPAGTLAPVALALPPVADTGFPNRNNVATGCFPNQVESVTIHGTRAFVTSICESPVGPIGPFTGPTPVPACAGDADCPNGLVGSCNGGKCAVTCTLDADCFGQGGGACFAGKCQTNCGADANCPGGAAGSCNLGNHLCKTNCNAAADCGSNGGVCNANVCATNTVDAKTTTHPALSVVDLVAGTATTSTLDNAFDAFYAANAATFPDTNARRMPLVANDLAFATGTKTGYLTANGADAVFRIDFADDGSITSVGTSGTNAFVNLNTAPSPGQGPIGIVTGVGHTISLVASDITRNVAVLSTSTDALGTVVQSSPLPMAGSAADDVRIGKRFFNTGLARWSLKGQGWGACQVCHIDGLTDNVTWYFARGPRQTISLDGTFASNDPLDQRVLNWTSIFDEISDFEGNTRGVSGGIGAMVSTVSSPLAVSDRIDLTSVTIGGAKFKEDNLNGSSAAVGIAPGVATQDPAPVLGDWAKITKYVQSLRSPRRPTTLVPADVAAGLQIFKDPTQGNCVGCHSGPKWTVSKVFYTPEPTDTTSNKLFSTSWAANALASGFPLSLYPSADPALQVDRGPSPPNGAFDQLVCTLRPVGTIGISGGAVVGVSPPEVNVQEVRQDHATPGQGAGTAGTLGRNGAGFNMPSVLNMQAGAPYFHAGNARTLEEAFSSTFKGHFQSGAAPAFSPTATQVRQIVQYLLTIDETQPPFAIPAEGPTGGDICVAP